MPIFHQILNSKIAVYRENFLSLSRNVFVGEDGKIIHDGEFGGFREEITRSFLRSFVPHRLDISDGFLVNAAGEVSTQADVVIYDGSASPMIEITQSQRFFPVEAVCGVGEVKSVLDGSALRRALKTLMAQKVKAIRRPAYLGDVNPMYHQRDQVVSFLVCESFKFKADPIQVVASAYVGCQHDEMHRHNVILSIKDGVMLYEDPSNLRDLAFPARSSFPNRFRWYAASEDRPVDHIARFCHLLFSAVSEVETFGVDMANYVDLARGGFVDGRGARDPSRPAPAEDDAVGASRSRRWSWLSPATFRMCWPGSR